MARSETWKRSGRGLERKRKKLIEGGQETRTKAGGLERWVAGGIERGLGRQRIEDWGHGARIGRERKHGVDQVEVELAGEDVGWKDHDIVYL